MSNIFYNLYCYFINRKWLFFGFLLLILASLSYVSLQLKLEEDITKLIPQSEESKTLNKILKNTDFSDRIIVNISIDKRGELHDLTDYAHDILDSLEINCKEYILNVQGEYTDVDVEETMQFIHDNLPLFLEDKDYQYLESKFSNDSLSSIVLNNYKTLISPGGMIAKGTLRKDPFGLSFRALEKLKNLKISDNFEIFRGFLTTKDKKNILLFIKPKLPTNETDANSVFVDKLYLISEELNTKYQNRVHSEYYGSTVIAVGNANQIKNDIKYTVSISLIILLLLLVFFYKRIVVPFFLFVPTVFGAFVGIVTLILLRDEISAISLGIGSVLLGITLDYSLHILTHFRKNNNVKKLYKDVTMPVLMSSVTTAVAFLCLLLLRSQALQDLGIFAAVSVISTSLFALIIIPLFYTRVEQKGKLSVNFIEKIAAYSYDKNKYLYISILVLFVISFFTLKDARFNRDLSKMNFQSKAILHAEKNLDSIMSISSKSIYIVAYGDKLNDVLEANSKISKELEQYKQSDKINQFSSNGSIVLSIKEQQKKLEMWNSFWTDSVKHYIETNFIKYGRNFGFKESTYSPFYELLNKDYTTINFKDYAEIESLMASEYISDKNDLKTAVSLIKIGEKQADNLQEMIKHIPNSILIDRKSISETFLGGLKDDFSTLINYSFLAIIIILFLFYRNLELTLLTVIPIILTWVLTLGIMGVFKIEFTIFNVIISTFIFGLGVDYSIFMTNALIKDYTFKTKEISTYKVSIVLSVITTVLGVGVLVFAKHPALRSISILSLIGIFITVFVTFTIQPLLFRVFVSNRANNGFAPIRIRSFVHSLILLFYYGLGSIFLSITSIALLPLIPVSKKIKFELLHRLMAKFLKSVLYANPLVSKDVINDNNESFAKPAIIIANHASSLDTLSFGLITPKVIYMVNDWVYKSPIFGILAKTAGFYPVSNGVDDSSDHLKEKVRQGYSLVVFPEAKRSLTNRVGRFHKGAFFLQEQLQIDILPIYLHGNAEVMPKGDLIIHNGSLTVKVGKRIAYDDWEYGVGYRERNKKISKYFKNELLGLRSRIEDENYFKGILFSNYIFKSEKIINFVKEDFKTNKNLYHQLNMKLPMKSKILHIADDYGQLDILLVSKYLDRRITTFIKDVNKCIIAKNCYTSQRRRVKYIKGLVNLDMRQYDTLLLTDKEALHFISEKEFNNFNSVVIVDKVHFKIKEFDKRLNLSNDLFILVKNYLKTGK